MGGVIITNQTAIEEVREASARLSQSFWQLAEAKRAIEKATERKIRTVGVILNGASSKKAAEAKRFVEHLWAGDADDVIEADPKHKEELAEQLGWLSSQ